MRIKRFLVVSLFLFLAAGAGATIQHKTPADPGDCPSGEYWCETVQTTETLPDGTIVVHAPQTKCRCAG